MLAWGSSYWHRIVCASVGWLIPAWGGLPRMGYLILAWDGLYQHVMVSTSMGWFVPAWNGLYQHGVVYT